MAKRKVTVTATFYYSKQVSVEVEVDAEIKDDDLIDYLSFNEELDKEIENRMDKAELSVDDSTFEYHDSENEFGGHL